MPRPAARRVMLQRTAALIRWVCRRRWCRSNSVHEGMLILWRRELPSSRVLAGIVISILLSACARDGGLEAVRQTRIANDPDVMLRIAVAAQQSGDHAGAVSFYRRASVLRPNSVEAQLGTARSLAELGSIDEATDVLRSAHARNPADARVVLPLGRLLVAADRSAEALKVFLDGLQTDPASVPMLIGKGVALDGLGRHAEAQSAYQQVLTIDPDNTPARTDLDLSRRLQAGVDSRNVFARQLRPSLQADPLSTRGRPVPLSWALRRE